MEQTSPPMVAVSEISILGHLKFICILDMRLRGMKGWGLSGGVVTPTVIKTPDIVPGSTFDGIFHITDWFTTLANQGLESPVESEDSIDHYQALINNEPVRDDLMIHVDLFRYLIL